MKQKTTIYFKEKGRTLQLIDVEDVEIKANILYARKNGSYCCLIPVENILYVATEAYTEEDLI